MHPRSGDPRSVIVKRIRQDPNGFRVDPVRMLTERAALEFLDGDIGPRLLAVDAEAGALVLEDLAPRVTLLDLLRDADPAATIGLRSFARTMGRLHATTAGRADAYYARRAALGPVDRAWDHRRLLGEPRSPAPEVVMGPAAEADLAEARRVLFTPGPFTAFSNGDSGANNFLVDGDDGRIIDWEAAGYRHALADAAALHVPGPQWMTVRDPSADGVADAYRDALVEGVPGAEDDRAFGSGLASACLLMAVERLARLPVLDSRPAGHESRAQMVSTLETAARVADRLGHLPALAAWAHLTAVSLRNRWPEADRLFPDAYTTRA